MVVDQQWTGTDADRHDMEKLELDQVLRVRIISSTTLSHHMPTRFLSLIPFPNNCFSDSQPGRPQIC